MQYILMVAIAATMFWQAMSAGVLAETTSLGEPLPVLGKYTAPQSDKSGKPRGISGMSCLRGSDTERECLAINDEETSAEIVVLSRAGLRPTGKLVGLTRKGDSTSDILGSEQKANCGEVGKYGEFDGEGVAVSDDYVYIVGSHSCTGGGKYKSSSYLLARFKPASFTSFVGGSAPIVERSWRGADMLLLTKEVQDAYGKPKSEGTNIEGVAVVGDTLYAGLRTPVRDGTSFIVNARTTDLFAPGHARLEAVGEPISLCLGVGAGIRDLAALTNGGLLILSGPTESQQDVPYDIWYLPTPLKTSRPVLLTTVGTRAKPKDDDSEVAKAESITVTDEREGNVTLIVSYDNIDEGAPAVYRLDIAQQPSISPSAERIVCR